MNCPFCGQEGELYDSGAKISGFIVDTDGSDRELEVQAMLYCDNCHCAFLQAGNKLFEVHDIPDDYYELEET